MSLSTSRRGGVSTFTWWSAICSAHGLGMLHAVFVAVGLAVLVVGIVLDVVDVVSYSVGSNADCNRGTL